MKPLYKKALISLGIYLSLIFLGVILNGIAPSGPCAPGPVILVAFIFPFVTLGLFFKDMHYYLINNSKDSGLSFLINSIAMLTLVLLYFFIF